MSNGPGIEEGSGTEKSWPSCDGSEVVGTATAEALRI